MGADFESLCLAFIQKDRQEQGGQGQDCAGGEGRGAEDRSTGSNQALCNNQELFLQVSPGKGPARSSLRVPEDPQLLPDPFLRPD